MLGRLGWLLGAALAGCGSAGSSDRGDDEDGGVDADTDTDGDPCGVGESWCGGACVRLDRDEANCGACDFVCAPVESCQIGRCVEVEPRTFRVTAFAISSPESLTSAVVQGAVDQSIEDFAMNWLVRLSATCEYTTGAALPVPPECDVGCDAFEFETEYPPRTGDGTCTEEGFRIPEEPFAIQRFDIPVRGAVPLVLPFRELWLEADFVAVPPPDASGTAEAMLTVYDMLEVRIESLGTTLCAIVSGDYGVAGYDDDCANVLACHVDEAPPDATWICGESGTPPDTEVEGVPAWTTAGTFDAVSVTLVE